MFVEFGDVSISLEILIVSQFYDIQSKSWFNKSRERENKFIFAMLSMM